MNALDFLLSYKESSVRADEFLNVSCRAPLSPDRCKALLVVSTIISTVLSLMLRPMQIIWRTVYNLIYINFNVYLSGKHKLHYTFTDGTELVEEYDLRNYDLIGWSLCDLFYSG